MRYIQRMVRGPLATALMLLAAVTLRGQAVRPPNEAPSSFLGLAVTSGISQGPDGLTELHGIHNAIWSPRLPVTEDLRVYTRWSGSGRHRVQVRIADRSSGVILGDTSDSIDFGDAPVSWFTHDFPGTRFPKAGAYAVEVTLDGENVATYALYVNAAELLPEDPAFVISVPAERGLLDRRGSAEVSGIFEYFSFPAFPARDSLSLVTVWFSGAGSFEHAAEIRDAHGKTIARAPSQKLRATHGEMSVITNTFDSIEFPSPGIYTATIYLNGTRVLSYPLVIRAR